MILRTLATNIFHRTSYNHIFYNFGRSWPTLVAKYSFAYGRRDLEKLDELLKDYNDEGDWNQIKGNLISSTRCFNETNVDSVMIQRIIINRSFDIGKEFITHLKSSGVELNLGTIGHILKFYYSYAYNNSLTNEEIQFIYDTYEYLNKKYKVLDPITLSNCILSLSVTPKWKECISLYYKLKECSNVSTQIYSRIIVSAFNNEEIDIGWNILHELINNKQIPKDDIYISWINLCIKKYKQKTLLNSMEKMINYIERHDLVIGQDTANLLDTIFLQKLNWKSEFVKIGNNGKCSSCNQVLDEVVLKEDEYNLLQKSFYEKVLIGENVYLKTNPVEIKNFLEFLKHSPPYDIVVDGLNVIHSTADKSAAAQSRILNAVVDYFLKQNKRVLILGRKHIENLIKKHLYGAKIKNTGLFFTENLSYDDPFLLLAALSSPNCYFISRDLMRGHKFLLDDDKVRNLFKRWQQSRQYMLITVTKFGNVVCKEPLKYLQTPQKKIGWHIPFGDIDSDQYFASSNWLCLQPNIKTKKKSINK